MCDFKINMIKIISSLPGRIRFNVKGLIRNEEKALKVKSELDRYNSILRSNVSKITGNVLIYYNTDQFHEDNILIIVKKAFDSPTIAAAENNNNSSLVRSFIDAANPFFLFKRKYSKRIYRNEYGISCRLFKISVAISAIVFLFTGSAANAVSIFILGYPGILFALAAASYYYVSDKLNTEKIYVKDNTSLNLLGNIHSLLIEEKVFKSKFRENGLYGTDLSKYDIQKLIILQKLDNPVSENIKLVVNNIRMLGISNIFIIGNSDNGMTNYMGYLLGMKVLDRNELKKKRNPLMIGKSGSNNTVLITTDKLLQGNLKYPCIDSTICLYENDRLSSSKADFNLKYSHMDKLPLLIKLAYFCREANVQTENMAVTLNVLGMLLAALNYLTPLYSIIYYILNTLLMTLTLKLRFRCHKNFNTVSCTRYDCLTD